MCSVGMWPLKSVTEEFKVCLASLSPHPPFQNHFLTAPAWANVNVWEQTENPDGVSTTLKNKNTPVFPWDHLEATDMPKAKAVLLWLHYMLTLMCLVILQCYYIQFLSPLSWCLPTDLVFGKSLCRWLWEVPFECMSCASRQKCFVLSIIVCDSLTDYLSSKMTS